MGRSFSPLLNRWIPQGSFARNVSLLAGGTALSQVLAILVSPILTRIYMPSDFGALQIFIALMSLVVVAAAGRYEVALLLPEDEQSAIDVLAVACLPLLLDVSFQCPGTASVSLATPPQRTWGWRVPGA
jgi:hypothetical protein